MSDEVCKRLSEAIDAFLLTVPPNVRYYGMGGDVEIPTAAELALVAAFAVSPPRRREQLAPIAANLNLRQAELLGTFSIRMAIFAARKRAVYILSPSFFGIVIDNDLVDWRDTLLTLSVIEDCAVRLGTNFKSVVQDAVGVATERRRSLIAGWFSRVPEMRSIKVMRIEAIADGNQLEYRQKPWPLSQNFQ